MRYEILTIAVMLFTAMPVSAQGPRPDQSPDYVVGAQDVLLITSYDQPELTGKFAVQTDGTFTYPLIGRVTVGGLTLRAIEGALEKQLFDAGLFTDPQIAVAMDQYRSQKVFVVGEVRTPGAYPKSGDMRLVEALASAGSTLPTASGEAVIVHANETAIVGPSQRRSTGSQHSNDESVQGLIRVNLRELAKGDLSQNPALSDGDTIFVLRAESVYVFGQVKNPGAYPLQGNTTVLQALSMAGGVTDRGSTGRIHIVRIVNGAKQEIEAELTDDVLPLDTIVVPERFF
jgi:polysaccharide export outer membrane protein